MSLPYWATFYNGKDEVSKTFVNCGWFDTRRAITRVIRDMELPTSEWTSVNLYQNIYTKKEVERILSGKDNDRLWESKGYRSLSHDWSQEMSLWEPFWEELEE